MHRTPGTVRRTLYFYYIDAWNRTFKRLLIHHLLERMEAGESMNNVRYSNVQNPLEMESTHHNDTVMMVDSLTARSRPGLLPQYQGSWIFVGTILFLAGAFVGYASRDSSSRIVTKYYTSSSSSTSNSFQAAAIAFGSCTGYDLRPLSIWTDAIIPSKPDVWIWTGDMVYLDDNEVNCFEYQDTDMWQRTCNCTATWLAKPPYRCKAGDVDYANQRWIASLKNKEYNQFLDYMCPRSRSMGYFPPVGTDPAICDRAIYGIYDDHDFGYDNSNGVENSKNVYKNMYLDAIGEPQLSPRRGAERGAWTKYTLNEGVVGSEIDIFLLDERYERDVIPCENRRAYCELVLDPVRSLSSSARTAHNIAWCQNFLLSGVVPGTGACCDKDEQIFLGWCKLPSSIHSKYYRHACDVTYEGFAQLSLVLKNGDLVPPDGTEPFDVYQASPICEVLGKTQRMWLRSSLSASSAALKVIVSGSVLMANPLPSECANYIDLNASSSTYGQEVSVNCTCSKDDIDCYPAAQQELFHLISNVSGCAVVLTGDYHFSDIKKLLPGKPRTQNYPPYVDVYHSQNNSQPIYQIMSSGMSYSTGLNYTCESFRKDPLKLRTHPECDFVTGPNFGRIVVEYTSEFMHDVYENSRGSSTISSEKHPAVHHSVEQNATRKNVESLDARTGTIGNIKGISLQVLSGLIENKILLSTDVDIDQCNPLLVEQI